MDPNQNEIKHPTSQPPVKTEPPDELPRYSPENVLQAGAAMVKELSGHIKSINIGNKLRKDVWIKEIDDLLKQKLPRTMIAICGATGAGKSSLLNAVLDDNIVPTSGLRACTSVITEISYQKKKAIDADVSFLSLQEWKDELKTLLDYLIEEDGTLSSQLKSMRTDAGISWQKVHAVYPLLEPQQLLHMSVEQIVQSSPATAEILGTIKKISAPNSKKFADEIGKYVDSKDRKRAGKRKRIEGKFEKAEAVVKVEEMEMEKVEGIEKAKEMGVGTGMGMGMGDASVKGIELGMRNENKNENEKEKEKEKAEEPEPALWPLIRLVQVRCPSEVLSTGAILVDLPGVADANAARSAIAKEYAKKCEYVWIAAPITRAVDDRIAKDLLGDAFKTQLINGGYDENCITFIATKTDDISCSELIRNLGLSDDPALVKLDKQINKLNARVKGLAKKQKSVEKDVTALEKGKKTIIEIMSNFRIHLTALRGGEQALPPLKTKGTPIKKRHLPGRYSSRLTKRLKLLNPDSNDEAMSLDGKGGERDASSATNNGVESDLDSNSGSGEESDGEHSDRDELDEEPERGDDGDAMDVDQEEIATEESLEWCIKENDEFLEQMNRKIQDLNTVKGECRHSINELKQDIQRLEKEKDAFCALKRNKYTSEILKEDFRLGLQEIDEGTAEKKNRGTLDPTQPRRDYASIDLPIFTCSSRDYIRISKQVKRDGPPKCFSNKEDTGIPALQKWCLGIGHGPQEHIAKEFLHHLAIFLQQVTSYISNMGGANIQDRITLRDQWETKENQDAELNGAQLYKLPDFDASNPDSDKPFNSHSYPCHAKLSRGQHDKCAGTGNGISGQLQKALLEATKRGVEELKKKFRTNLEKQCTTGAHDAEMAALKTSDSFAASKHWQTYKAALCRLGEFKSADLNLEMVAPLRKEIASPWARFFHSDLFGPMNQSIIAVVQKLIKEVEDTSTPSLKDRCKTQGQLSLQEAEEVMSRLIPRVKHKMKKKQKEISRSFAPHVRSELLNGYEGASLEKGPGSVARRKDKFQQFVQSKTSIMFTSLSDDIFKQLDSVADAIQTVMDDALDSLSNKIEVNMSLLWEIRKDDEERFRERKELSRKIGMLEESVKMWMDAGALKEENCGDEDQLCVRAALPQAYVRGMVSQP